MKRRKKTDLKILVSAMIVSGLLFGAGVFTGYVINMERFSSIEKNIRSVSRDVENFQLQFLFFDVLGENSTCLLLTDTLSSIDRQSYDIGSRLTAYGAEAEIQDYNEFVGLKKEYSRLLISYWLLANKLRESCRINTSTIIYFFSEDCARCDDQGFVLTYLKNKLKNRLLVFALDGEFEEPSVQTLKKYYNINSYPSLVIDGKLYEGFIPESGVREIVCKNIDCSDI